MRRRERGNNAALPLAFDQEQVPGRISQNDGMQLKRSTRKRTIRRTKLAGFCWLTLGAILTLSGCGRSTVHSTDAGEPHTVETNPAPAAAADSLNLAALKQAFASSRPAMQVYVDEAIAVIRARAYDDGIEQLHKVARHQDLTPHQLQAVQDTILRLRPFAEAHAR